MTSSMLKKLFFGAVLLACMDQMLAPAYSADRAPRGTGDRAYQYRPPQPLGPYELNGCKNCKWSSSHKWISRDFCCKCPRTKSGKSVLELTCVSKDYVKKCQKGFMNIQGKLTCMDGIY